MDADAHGWEAVFADRGIPTTPESLDLFHANLRRALNAELAVIWLDSYLAVISRQARPA